MRGLGGFGGQRLVVEFAGGVGIQRQRELVGPAELEPRPAQRVVTLLGARMPLARSAAVRGNR